MVASLTSPIISNSVIIHFHCIVTPCNTNEENLHRIFIRCISSISRAKLPSNHTMYELANTCSHYTRKLQTVLVHTGQLQTKSGNGPRLALQSLVCVWLHPTHLETQTKRCKNIYFFLMRFKTQIESEGFHS